MKAFLDWEDRSTFAKVIAPFEFPFAVALRVTIPLVEHKTWSRTFSALCIVRIRLILVHVSRCQHALW
jgi:hypothetical protein